MPKDSKLVLKLPFWQIVRDGGIEMKLWKVIGESEEQELIAYDY